MRPLRNVAIIAHVDHGKTTLVDALLGSTNALAHGEGVDACILDSNPLERERGITIQAKNCSIAWRPGNGPHAGEDVRINIIDTPGHADFGGEVERVLGMADGALLLVDAFEGPMPQTRFVLEKALRLGLRLLVVVNKCDRPDARFDAVVDEIFDLLVALDAPDEVLDFPVIFASGRSGWASASATEHDGTVVPLLEAIVRHLPSPSVDPDGPLQMLVTTLDASAYTGRIAVGRVVSGTLRSGQPVAVCRAAGRPLSGRVQKLYRFVGLARQETTLVEAGDLCAIEGLPAVDIGDTIADVENPVPLPRVSVDEPTLRMVFRVNDSPLAGREGTFVTARQLADRLRRELERNVALRVDPGPTSESFHVAGRGLLHLGILLEEMRREGFELAVGRPEVIERDIDGVRCEPLERLTLDVPPDVVGPALELIGQRGAEILDMEPRGDRTHVVAEIPARGLIGLKSRMLTATGGEAVMSHSFAGWTPLRGADRQRVQGVLVATEPGAATSYALQGLADRGVMFVLPTEPVYEGMIVGEHARGSDLDVNVVKAKGFSNVRESNKEATVTLKAPRRLTLEAALEYIEPDELVEITPSSIRLRKAKLRAVDRRKQQRQAKQRAASAE